MNVHKAFKFRIYPTKEQENFLSQQFGAVRFVYNYFLNNRKNEYLNNKKSLKYKDDQKHLTQLKNTDGYDWLYDINSQTLQGGLRNLEVAYNNFHRKTSGFPKFHSKKYRQSIKIPQNFYIENNQLFIPKLKTGIKIKQHQELPNKPYCLFITKLPCGKYYASFAVETEIASLPKSEDQIGIDLGIKELIITSQGELIKNEQFYRKHENKIKYESRQFSKKQKGSKRKEKQRLELAKINNFIADSRNNYLHQITKKLINENQIIVAESLSVKNMIKNHKLAKSIQDSSWGEIIRQLKYKSEWYGRTFIQVDRWFPSSKTCSNCQFIVEKLPLSIRFWKCEQCNTKHDRDVNAAINILNKGLKDIESGSGIELDVKQKLGEALLKVKKPKALKRGKSKNREISESNQK